MGVYNLFSCVQWEDGAVQQALSVHSCYVCGIEVFGRALEGV